MTRHSEQVVKKADHVIHRAEEEQKHVRSLLTTIRSTESFVQTYIERRRSNRGHVPERRSGHTNGAKA